MNKKNKGFTLIELLVVIAIIGILSGLIIVSLGDATNQAKEAKINSALDQLRPVAQIYYNKNSASYLNLASDPKVVNLIAEVADNGGALTLSASAGGYCAYSNTPSGKCMCVDSTGKVKQGNTGACSCSAQSCN